MTQRVAASFLVLLMAAFVCAQAPTAPPALRTYTGPEVKEVGGRPVALLFLPDGSMLITDDGANKIWRATYRAK
jgi:hypothetical protein